MLPLVEKERGENVGVVGDDRSVHTPIPENMMLIADNGHK